MLPLHNFMYKCYSNITQNFIYARKYFIKQNPQNVTTRSRRCICASRKVKRRQATRHTRKKDEIQAELRRDQRKEEQTGTTYDNKPTIGNLVNSKY